MVNLTTYMIATTCLIMGINALDQSSVQKTEEALQASNVLPFASIAAPKPSAAPGLRSDIIMNEINKFLATVGSPHHASVTAAASSAASFLSYAKSSIYNEVKKCNKGISHSIDNSYASYVPENASIDGMSKLDLIGILPGLIGEVINTGGNIVDGAAGAAIGIVDGAADTAAGLVNDVTGGALDGLAEGAANLVHDVAGTAGGFVAGATNAVDGVVGLIGDIIGGILSGETNGNLEGSVDGSVGNNGNIGMISGNSVGVSGSSGESSGSLSVSYGETNDISSENVVIPQASGPLKRAILNMNGDYSDIIVAPPASNEYVAQDGSSESVVIPQAPVKRAILNLNGEYSDIAVAPPVTNEYAAQDGSPESIVLRLASASPASASPTKLVLRARAGAISSAHSSYLSSVSAQAQSASINMDI